MDKWSPDVIAAQLQERVAKGQSITPHQLPSDLHAAIDYHFRAGKPSAYEAAVTYAGLQPQSRGDRPVYSWTLNEVYQRLHAVFEAQGRISHEAVKILDTPLYRAITVGPLFTGTTKERFKQALIGAGLPYKGSRSRKRCTRWSVVKITQSLQALAERGVPMYPAAVHRANRKLYLTIKNGIAFKGRDTQERFDKAVSAAGLEPEVNPRWWNQERIRALIRHRVEDHLPIGQSDLPVAALQAINQHYPGDSAHEKYLNAVRDALPLQQESVPR